MHYPPIGDTVMADNASNPEQESAAMAYHEAMESARRKREEEVKRHIRELEEIVLHTQNDFAD
jgi:hypothetical protein